LFGPCLFSRWLLLFRQPITNMYWSEVWCHFISFQVCIFFVINKLFFFFFCWQSRWYWPETCAIKLGRSRVSELNRKNVYISRHWSSSPRTMRATDAIYCWVDRFTHPVPGLCFATCRLILFSYIGRLSERSGTFLRPPRRIVSMICWAGRTAVKPTPSDTGSCRRCCPTDKKDGNVYFAPWNEWLTPVDSL